MAKKTLEQYVTQLADDHISESEIMTALERLHEINPEKSLRDHAISMVRSQAQYKRHEREAFEARWGKPEETALETETETETETAETETAETETETAETETAETETTGTETETETTGTETETETETETAETETETETTYKPQSPQNYLGQIETPQVTVKTFPVIYIDHASNNVILLEVNGQNLQSTNRKLRLNHGDAQLTILPLESVEYGRQIFTGKGSLARAQESSCAESCLFRVKDSAHPERLGGCYVNHLGAKAEKVKRTYQEIDSLKYVHLTCGAFIRATVWGDLGRLSKSAQEYVKSMLLFTGSHLAYISDTQTAQTFYGLAQKSCQTKPQVLEAILSGWKVYAGTRDAALALKELGASPVYHCPIKGDGQDRFGCVQCPIQCNGQRHVVAHGVGHV